MKVTVLGAGESGVGAALLAKKMEMEVWVSDYGKIENKNKEVLEHHQIAWEENGHSEEEISNSDMVVKSPGISDQTKVVRQIEQKGIPVVSEIEFASKFNTMPTIGITGSNGKTTTTLWVHHVLSGEIKNIGLAGNIGESYARQVAEKPDCMYVLELSSFQLDGIVNYRPHIAVITNISPDHLDRYAYRYENYIDAKFRITKNQTEQDYLIYDADDIEIERWLQNHEIKARKVPFSIAKELEYGVYVKDEKIVVNMDNEKLEMPVKELALEGKHNVKNAMAATAVAQLMRIRKQTIRESLSSFQGVEHRLEKVLKIDNVQYINDSKATNVNATFYALESVKAPVVWIVGGVDKGNDYDELMPLVREKVKAIVCLGVDNEKIRQAYQNVVDLFIETQSMTEAVQIAAKAAESGDTVLLSPACASFDLFENYEARGKEFKQAVYNL